MAIKGPGRGIPGRSGSTAPIPPAPGAGSTQPLAVPPDDDGRRLATGRPGTGPVPAPPGGEAVSLGQPGWPPAANDDAPEPAWPAYGELFGAAPYVRDPADRKLLDLMKAALAAEPGLAKPTLGPAIATGKVPANAIKALQQVLAAKGYDLGPAGVDGKYGPKTHAALVGLLQHVAPGTSPGPGPGVPPTGPAPRLDLPPPPPVPPPAPRTPPASLPPDTKYDAHYQLGAPPPAGYKVVKGSLPKEVVAKAHSLLGKPFGTETYFQHNGKKYVARNEPHYHPPDFIGGPTGWHSGVTIYEAG